MLIFLILAITLFVQPLLAVIVAIAGFLRMGKLPSGPEISRRAFTGNLILGLAALPVFVIALYAAAGLSSPGPLIGFLSLTLLPFIPVFTGLGEIRWLSPLCAALAMLPVPVLFGLVTLRGSHGLPVIFSLPGY